MLDVVPPDPGRLLAAARAIEGARQDGEVLIYCALGYSRSPSVVATWLATTGRAGNVDDAVGRERAVRPRILLGDDAKQAIAEAVERAQ